MSKSKSKKKISKLVKQGHFDVRKNRLTWYGINPITRKTPTKQEREERHYLKYHKR